MRPQAQRLKFVGGDVYTMALDLTISDYSDIEVLVIDDDADIVELVVALLKEMGVGEIGRAENVYAAIEKFADRNARIKLIICDWMMPGMNGLEFLEKVRQIDATIPFLMLTAKSTEASVLEAKDLGVTRYVVKPFNLGVLRTKLTILLDEIAAKST